MNQNIYRNNMRFFWGYECQRHSVVEHSFCWTFSFPKQSLNKSNGEIWSMSSLFEQAGNILHITCTSTKCIVLYVLHDNLLAPVMTFPCISIGFAPSSIAWMASPDFCKNSGFISTPGWSSFLGQDEHLANIFFLIQAVSIQIALHSGNRFTQNALLWMIFSNPTWK